MKYSIYILISFNKPVYVGVSSNITYRIKKHKETKVFDSYLILRSFINKKDAYNYEKGIIDFMTFFHNSDCLNDSNFLIPLRSIIKIN